MFIFFSSRRLFWFCSWYFSASIWPTLLHEIRGSLGTWQQASAAGSVVWDAAASACLDILECLWTTAPDSWSYQAWAFRAILSPIACQASDLGVGLPRVLYVCNRCSTCCRLARMRFSLWMHRTLCFWTKRCRVEPPHCFDI
jgi:hypothetical protein